METACISTSGVKSSKSPNRFAKLICAFS
ncbi:uncharacterized protein METZ01_LOCUS417868, partial [marine metagenome]